MHLFKPSMVGSDKFMAGRLALPNLLLLQITLSSVKLCHVDCALFFMEWLPFKHWMYFVLQKTVSVVLKIKNKISCFLHLLGLFYIFRNYRGCVHTDVTILQCLLGIAIQPECYPTHRDTMIYKFLTTLTSLPGFSNLISCHHSICQVKIVENGKTTMSCILKFTLKLMFSIPKC